MDIPRDARQWRLIDLLERYLPGPTAHLVSWARSDESLSTAASLAFFALVSLPPTALIGFWAAGLMAGDERISQLGEQLAALAPAEMGADGMLLQLVEVAATLGWTSVLAALWPATAYGAGLARAFDRLTPTGRRRMDGLRGRVLVVVLIALLPLLILGALLVVLFLPQLLGEQVVVRVLGLALAGLIAVAALTAILALLYAVLPRRRRRRRGVPRRWLGRGRDHRGLDRLCRLPASGGRLRGAVRLERLRCGHPARPVALPRQRRADRRLQDRPPAGGCADVAG